MKQLKDFPNYWIDDRGIVYRKNKKRLYCQLRGGYPRVWLYNRDLRTDLNPSGRAVLTVRNLVADTFLSVPSYLLHLPKTRLAVRSKNGRTSECRLSELQIEDSKLNNYPYCSVCYRFHKVDGDHLV